MKVVRLGYLNPESGMHHEVRQVKWYRVKYDLEKIDSVLLRCQGSSIPLNGSRQSWATLEARAGRSKTASGVVHIVRCVRVQLQASKRVSGEDSDADVGTKRASEGGRKQRNWRVGLSVPG